MAELLLVLNRHFSTAQKTAAEASSFGQGFNYRIEAGFSLVGLRREAASQALAAAVAKVDHRALGVDLNLGFEPSSENLLRYLRLEIAREVPLVSLRLIRGDGAVFSSDNSPKA